MLGSALWDGIDVVVRIVSWNLTGTESSLLGVIASIVG